MSSSIKALPMQNFTNVAATEAHTTVQVVGNHLEVYDAQQKVSNFVSSIGDCDWSNATNISCLQYHAPKQLLVLVVEGDDFSRAHIFKYKEQTLLCTIEGCTATCVSLSHDGSVLYAVDGRSDPVLFAWHIPSGESLIWRSANHCPKFPSNVSQCAVDPFNTNRIVAFSDSGMYVCNLIKQALYFTANITTVQFSEELMYHRPQSAFMDTGLEPLSSIPQMKDFVWASGVLFMVTNDGQLMALNVGTARVSRVRLDIEDTNIVTSVTSVVDYVVVGFLDGTVRWFAKDDYSLAHTITLPGSHTPVTALRPLPSYHFVLACQGRTQITRVPLNIDEEAGPIPDPEVLRSSVAFNVNSVLSLDAKHFLGVTSNQLAVYATETNLFTECYCTQDDGVIVACDIVANINGIVIGDSDGTITLLSLDITAEGSAQAKVCGTIQLHDAPVIGFAIDGDLIGCLYADAIVVCRLGVDASPAIVAYSRTDGSKSSGSLLSATLIAGPNAYAFVTDTEGSIYQVNLLSTKAPAPSTLTAVNMDGEQLSSGTRLVQGAQNIIFLYNNLNGKVSVMDTATNSLRLCFDAGSSISALSISGHHCLVGTADGSVQLWNIGSVDAQLMWKTSSSGDIHALAMAIDIDIANVIVFGRETSVLYSTNVSATSAAASATWSPCSIIFTNSPSADDTSKLAEAIETHTNIQNQRIEAMQSKIMAKTQPLRDEAIKLIERNDDAAELDKMIITEFCINTRGRDKQLVENDAASAKLRKQMLSVNTKKEILARRLKHMVWDSMQVTGRELHAFQNGIIVKNFSIPRMTSAEKAQLDRIVVLRKIELRDIRFGNHGGGSFHIRAAAWPGRLDEIPNSLSYIANADLHADQNTAVVEAAKDNNLGGEDDDDEGDIRSHEGQLEQLEYLVYHPCGLRTNRQRRAQVYLVRFYTIELMKKFNDIFEALGAKKSDALEQIASKNKRINEIVEELDGHEAVTNETFFEPVTQAMEIPQAIFEVADHEIPVERYISEAEQKKLDEEAELRRLAAQEVSDDPAQRALMDMMNGQLEARTEGVSSLEVVEKEAWMDHVPREKMNDEQLNAVAEYEARLAAYEQKKAEFEKALIQELRKLKTEVAEVVRMFDDQAKAVYKKYLDFLGKIYVQQMYSFRLVQSLNEHQTCLSEERRLRLSLGQVQRQFSQNEETIKELTVEVTDIKGEVDQLKLTDNSLAASFKKSLQESSSQGLDHDTLKIYLQLFKIRRARRRSSSRGSRTNGGLSSSNRSSVMNRSRGSRSLRKTSTMTGMSISRSGTTRDSEMRAAMAAAVKDTAVIMDPYRKIPTAAVEEQALADREDMMRPLTVEMDAPANLKPEPELWKRLNELRTSKIESELLLKTMTQNMNEKLALVQAMEHETDDLGDRMNDIIAQIEAQRALAQKLNWDCDVVLHVTQGQDEVRSLQDRGEVKENSSDKDDLNAKAGSVVARLLKQNDYAEAMLVDRSIIEQANEKVRKRGKDKISVLTKIKEFRKNINFMEWESEYMIEKAQNLDAHYTDLHMLRVTKKLQQFLQGSAGDHNKKQISKAEQTLKFNETSFTENCAKIKKKVRKAEKSIRSTKSECEKLESQKLAVAKLVAELESVAITSGGPASGSMAERATKAKMKAVVTRRKLIDLARAQTDEIEFLRKELDRLRQRTFPSFAHSRRAELQRLGHPDEQN